MKSITDIKKIKIYFPDKELVEEMVNTKGPFSFYKSIEERKECCRIRKVIPLKRALMNKDVWITGLRKEQSPERSNLSLLEWDEENKVIKYNPLLNWSFSEVRNYIKENKVPYNPLQDKGFISIGCSPCTRAIKEGESFRDGRWWWENNSGKECGLHS